MTDTPEGVRLLASFLQSSLASKGRFLAAVVEVLPVAGVLRALDESIALSSVKPARTYLIDAAHLPHTNIWSYLREERAADATTPGALVVVHGIESSEGFGDADPPFFRALNLQRDALAADFPCTWVLLMSRDARRRFQRIAPDFYDFCTEHVSIDWPEERLAEQKALGPANEIALRTLVSAVGTGDILLLAGAGISIRMGYPSWPALLDRMAKEVERIRPSAKPDLSQLAQEQDFLWRAQEYRYLLGEDAFDTFIRDSLGPDEAPFDDFHEDLVRLPVRHILTTAYDAVIEKAHSAVFKSELVRIEWRRDKDAAEFFQRLADAGYDRRIFFLHGRFSDPAAMVFSERDFAKFYLNSPDTRAKLLQLLATHKLVIVGSSLATAETMDVFREAKVRAGPGRPRHFALLPAMPGEDIALARRRLNGKYGIEPVFYPWSSDHAGLHDLVRRILGDVKPYAPRRRAPLYVHPLPQERAFQGRKVELVALRDRFSSDKPGVVGLVGLAGAGKTTLLARFLKVLTEDEKNLSVLERVKRTLIGDDRKPDALFVWSFDEEPDVDRCLRELGVYLSSASPREQQRSWQVQAVVELLRDAGGVVLALDGVDSIQAREADFYSFGSLKHASLRLLLKAIAGGCGKTLAVITSRLPLAELEAFRAAGYDEIAVGALPVQDAAALLQARGVKGGDVEREALAERFGRHALTVSLVGTMLAEFYGGDPAQASKIAGAAELQSLDQSGKLGKVLDDYQALIGAEAAGLLERIAAFQRGVTAGLLESVFLGPGKESVAGPLAGLAWPELRQVLDRLIRLGLVDSEPRYGEAVFTAHPFVKDHFYARLLRTGAGPIHDAIREALDAAAAPMRPETEPELDRMEELIHQTIHAGKAGEAFDIYANRLGRYDHLGASLGDYARGERITQEFLTNDNPSRPRKGLSDRQYVILFIDRAAFLMILGKVHLAEACAASLQVHAQRFGDTDLDSLSWWLLSSVHSQRGRLREAWPMMQKALDLVGRSSDSILVFHIRSLAASMQIELGDLPPARANIGEAQKAVDSDAVTRLMSQSGHSQATLLVRTGEPTKAIRLLQAQLATAERDRNRQSATLCHFALATAYRLCRDLPQARRHLQQARDFSVQSGWQACICRAHLIGGGLHLASGESAEAANEVTRGLAVAEQFGFGILRIDLLVLRGEIELSRDPAAAEATALEAQRLADDPACGYAWGLADALDLLGRARIARGLSAEARDPLERALALRETLTDPRAGETRKILSRL